MFPLSGPPDPAAAGTGGAVGSGILSVLINILFSINVKWFSVSYQSWC